MDKPLPKPTPKSQLMVFSPDVLKKMGITPQLTKLTTTGITTLAGNINQIKPNETDTNLLLNDVVVADSKCSELLNEKNTITSTDNVDKLAAQQSISMNEKTNTDAKYQLNLDELDPRVAEILTPVKRGRPKGKGKNKGSLQSFVVKEEIKAKEEIKTVERRRSGRPRKQKKLDDVVYYSETPEKSAKRSNTRNRNDNDNDNDKSASEDDDDKIVLNRVRRRRIRKKMNRLESDEDDDGEEIIKGSNKKVIECGVCGEKMENSLWAHHCTKHNYLCWRVGEAPIDLGNRKTVESVLLKVAAAKKVLFTCDKCGEKRKSVVGYLSHVDVCQKTDEERLAMRVQCPECHKLMQPCSLKIHMRNHIHESIKITKNQHEQQQQEQQTESTGRVKRNAAKKAQGLINQLTNENDEFTTSNKQKQKQKHKQKQKVEIKYFYKCANETEKKILSHGCFVRIFRNKLKEAGARIKCPIVDCNYEPVDLKDAESHLEHCSQLQLGGSDNKYICFFCYHIADNEQQINEHILQLHEHDKNRILFKNHTSDDDDDYKNDDDDDYQLSQQNDDDDDDDIEYSSASSASASSSSVKKQRKQVSLETGTTTSSRSYMDKVKFLANQIRISASRNCTYPAAGKWTQQFYLNNLIDYHEIIFIRNLLNINGNGNGNGNTKWLKSEILNNNNKGREEYNKYLPMRSKSISVGTILTSKTIPNIRDIGLDWKEFQLFQIEINNENDTLTIYCGGPISSIAWLPTTNHNHNDNDIVDQIVAVSVQRDFNATFKTSKSYASTQAIQFWNFRKLSFKTTLQQQQQQQQQEIKLEFLLAHNHGQVWAMEWCPAITEQFHLVALACSNGIIPIYSIYFLNHQQQQQQQHIKMFKPIETFKLIMQHDQMNSNLLGHWNYQCTKLVWSKIKEYNIIAAGYSNGMVCLWDLNTTSPLLKEIDENGTIILRPYLSFEAHTAAITALHFYYDANCISIRWLFTGSWDRNCHLWDLNEAAAAATVFQFNKRGNVSDGALINHWLCSFVSYDDVHSLEHTTTSIQSVRDFGFKSSSLLSANSMVMGLAASDWANAIAQVTLAGELCCTFQRQLVVGYDFDKNSKAKRFLLSYCEIIDKKITKNNNHDDDDDDINNYKNIKNKYGIIFCDIPLDNADRIPGETLRMVRTSSSMKDAPTEMYPIAAQNRVAWNPNKQAYNYICSGYQCGFLRLRCVRFIHSNLLTFIK